MTVAPTVLTPPSGWTALVTHNGPSDGYGIEWVASPEARLAPGATLAAYSIGLLPFVLLAVLMALGFFALTGRRAYRMVQENATLRLAEQRQNHLLRVLIENTGEGFWFIDNQARTVDANPAMCQMLGQPREALLGRSIFDFVNAENRAVFELELARRAAGSTAG